MKRPDWVSLCAISIALVAHTGCSALKKNEVPLTASSGLWERARIEYRVESRLLNANPVASRGDLQFASYERPLDGGLSANSVATVEIRCPHPDQRPGLAQVKVQIEGGDDSSAITAGMSGWRKSLVRARDKLPGFHGARRSEETWLLEIPQAEVAAIVDRLRASGYFNDYSQRPDDVQLDTELDGQRLRKTWSQLPELDALVLRARNDGRLASSTGPRGSSGHAEPTGQAASSLTAYRQTMGGDEGAAVASDIGGSPR